MFLTRPPGITYKTTRKYRKNPEEIKSRNSTNPYARNFRRNLESNWDISETQRGSLKTYKRHQGTKSKRNPKKLSKKSLEGLLQKSRKNPWKTIGKTSERTSENKFRKDRRKESSEKLWKHIGKTTGRNPGRNLGKSQEQLSKILEETPESEKNCGRKFEL